MSYSFFKPIFQKTLQLNAQNMWYFNIAAPLVPYIRIAVLHVCMSVSLCVTSEISENESPLETDLLLVV